MTRREFMALLGGAAIAWPLAAHAQHAGRSYRIGYLALTPGEESSLMRAFVDRLRELGLVEGQTMALTYRSAEGHPERLPKLAMELVDAKPDVLVAGFGTLAAKAAKAATSTIPVVFANVGDPLGAGLVASLSRPGGNVTGLSSQVSDLGSKRLQLLQEIVPRARVIGVLMNPQTPFTALALKEIRAAAEKARTDVVVLEVTAPDQMPGRFEAAAKTGVEAVIILEDPLIFSVTHELADLAVQHRLPTLFGDKKFVEAGGLMAYGPDRQMNFRRAAEYVDKILKGAKPADLAVEQPTKFMLVINPRTAKALDLTIPNSLLARVDEVIE